MTKKVKKLTGNKISNFETRWSKTKDLWKIVKTILSLINYLTCDHTAAEWACGKEINEYFIQLDMASGQGGCTSQNVYKS